MPQKKQPSSTQKSPSSPYSGADHRRMLIRLKRHLSKYGPLSHTKHELVDTKLVDWSRYVRSNITELSPKMKKALVEAGFFNYREEQWLANLERHCVFHQNPDAPQQPDIPHLCGIWARAQRKKRDQLQDFQIALLNEANFDWVGQSSWEKNWNTRYAELVAYQKRFGTCAVTAPNADRRLIKWVSRQRSKVDTLSDEQISRLNEIGFIWNPFETRWEKQYQVLCDFKAKHGHCYMPVTGEDCNSGNDPLINEEFIRWVVMQKSHYVRGTLRADLKERLDAVGFVWQAKEHHWETQFTALEAFHETHGHCLVPSRWPENVTLAGWVSAQRSQYKAGTLSKERKRRLKQLGFVWKLQERSPNSVWEERLAELKAYKKRFGHCDVPIHGAENKSLGIWVGSQRSGKAKLTRSQISQLDAIGFTWDVLSDKWHAKYKELEVFYKKHGHSRVPDRYEQNPGLGMWVQNVRHRPHAQNEERLALLAKLDFCWHPEGAYWEELFGRLKAYRKHHGHCLVPAIYPPDRSLGNWVDGQRQARKQGKLDKEKVRKLDSIGFVWDVIRWQWDQKLLELKAFKKRFGHCRVPTQGWVDSPSLGSWLSYQRSRWKKLSVEQQKLLEKLGVSSTPPTGPMPDNVKRYLERLSA